MSSSPGPRYRPTSVAMLRSPLRGGPRRIPAAGPRPVTDDICREVLRAAAADAVFMEALRVASPTLADLAEASTAPGGPAGKSSAQLRRAALSIARYEARMRSRATPFGLFAGVAPVRIGAAPKAVWNEPARSRTRVDLAWLAEVIRKVEGDPALFPRLTLHAHAGLVRRGGRIAVCAPSRIDEAPGGGVHESRNEVTVRITPVVEAVLELAAHGVESGVLVSALEERFPQAAPGAAARMVRSLTDQEFLISTLRPALDGSDPLAQTLRALEAVTDRSGEAPPVLGALRAVAEARDAYDSAAFAERAEAFATLVRRMRRVHDGERLVHVDMRLGTDVTLPREVAEEAARAARVLWRLSPAGVGAPYLRSYHGEFVERYGTGRVVPLAELLDDTTGLGPPAGYTRPGGSRGEPALLAPEDDRADRLLAAWAAEALRDGRREVVLDDAMVDRLAELRGTDPAWRAPSSCEFFGTLLADSEQALAQGEFLLAAGVFTGPRAGSSYGRFAGLLDTVNDELAEACRPGDGEPAVLTVAFHPRSMRASNIANSPTPGTYRLSLGVPPSPSAAELRLDEIGITADGSHLHVLHLPTGRRLSAQQHTAIDNHRQAPDAARLLLELGNANRRMLRPWSWGTVATAPYLPRVRHGRTVLAPARWLLDELRGGSDLEPAAWAAAVADWRRRLDVPRHVVLGHADRWLALDLTDALHLEVARDEMTKHADTVVQEPPGGQPATDSWLRTPEGDPCLPELSIPLVRDPAVRDPRPHLPSAPRSGAARQRAAVPGGEWLYAKLYLPGRHTDAFLCEQFGPWLRQLPEEVRDVVDRWFFIRYRDGEDHLRLRFHGLAQGLWQGLLPQLHEAAGRWTARGLAGRLVLDTYEPEWERYGGPEAQCAAEEFFCADSGAALTLLALARTHGTVWDKDTLAAIALADCATAIGRAPEGADAPDGRPLDPAAAWLEGWSGPGDLPVEFRARRRAYLRLVDPVGGWPELAQRPEGPRVRAALDRRAAALRAYLARLDELAATSWTPLETVVPSLFHMTCNRLLGPDRPRERRAHATARACLAGNADRRRHLG
ncbi:lantibiotic dehydratase [Streptomyces sp. NPDC050095]|uniref:lantibiotic dehydratase n=1 Tax=unclassified Streptomyces TaxID=2593676 RepID=UPI00342314E7